MDEAPTCWRCDQRLFRDVAGNKRADALVWPALDLIKGSLRLLASVLQHASFGKIRAHALASQSRWWVGFCPQNSCREPQQSLRALTWVNRRHRPAAAGSTATRSKRCAQEDGAPTLLRPGVRKGRRDRRQVNRRPAQRAAPDGAAAPTEARQRPAPK